MQLFRAAAFVLFLLATLAGYGVLIHSDVKAVIGTVASGLACLALSGFDPPAPPRP